MTDNDRKSLVSVLQAAGIRDAATRIGPDLQELIHHWLRLAQREREMLLRLTRDLVNVGRPALTHVNDRPPSLR
jgi:hypothetical protein